VTEGVDPVPTTVITNPPANLLLNQIRLWPRSRAPSTSDFWVSATGRTSKSLPKSHSSGTGAATGLMGVTGAGSGFSTEGARSYCTCLYDGSQNFGVVFRSRLGQVHARRYAPSCTMCRLTCSIEDGISGPSFAALVGRACEVSTRELVARYKRHCYGRALAAESKRSLGQLHAVYCWIVIC
jgi:hypothetical protein